MVSTNKEKSTAVINGADYNEKYPFKQYLQVIYTGPWVFKANNQNKNENIRNRAKI